MEAGSSTTPESAEGSKAYKKSNRISLACTSCRKGKRRCSGTKPCVQCVRGGRTASECIFPPHAARKRPGQRGNETEEDGNAQPRRSKASALAFFELVQRTVMGQTIESPNMEELSPAPVPTPKDDASVYALPHRYLSNMLIKQFFDVPGLVFPMLHRESFLNEYEAMWATLTTAQEPQPLFVALVYALLCIGATWYEEESFSTDIDIWFQRSRTLLSTHRASNTSPSLLLVQVHLYHYAHLCGRVASSEVDTDPALTFATKAAVALKLYEPTPQGLYDAIMIEARKRAWYGCCNFSSHLGLIAGPPPLTDSVNTTVALPQSWPDGSEESATDWMLHWSTLCQSVMGIVRTLYHEGQRLDLESCEELSLMLRLEADLERWRANLPEMWRIDAPVSSSTSRVQILRLRYSYARLMIMRPSLIRLLNPEGELLGRLQTLSWQSASSVCLEAAQELIEAAASAHNNVFYRCGKPYNCDYVLVGLAVLLSLRQRGNEVIDLHWDKALAGIHDGLPLMAERLQALKAHFARHDAIEDETLLEQLLAVINNG